MASEKGTRPVLSKTNSAIEGSAGIFSRFHNLLHTTSAPTHARRDFKAKPQIMSAPEKQHIHTWLEENLATLEPPVMNKMMYGDGQLKIMYVGGPNVRSDYHLEAGEELFYMHKGEMLLKIVLKNKFVDVPIKEGELLLLPGRIPHSPQRFKDTVGLVLERDRTKEETDCLRWYVPDPESPPEPLYEAFFHCTDLVTQLKPVIAAFYASEQKKTGKPLPGTIMEASKTPIQPNSEIDIPKPVNLAAWVQENSLRIASSAQGYDALSDHGEFKVHFFVGQKSSNVEFMHEHGEAFIWQWAGAADVEILAADGSVSSRISLNKDEVYLIQQGIRYRMVRPEHSQGFVIRMVPQ